MCGRFTIVRSSTDGGGERKGECVECQGQGLLADLVLLALKLLSFHCLSRCTSET